jgi:hypothetical protein
MYRRYKSGLRFCVVAVASRSRQAAISWWLPEVSGAGTARSAQTAGRV